MNRTLLAVVLVTCAAFASDGVSTQLSQDQQTNSEKCLPGADWISQLRLTEAVATDIGSEHDRVHGSLSRIHANPGAGRSPFDLIWIRFTGDPIRLKIFTRSEGHGSIRDTVQPGDIAIINGPRFDEDNALPGVDRST